MNGMGMLEVRYRRLETIIRGQNMGLEKFKIVPWVLHAFQPACRVKSGHILENLKSKF